MKRGLSFLLIDYSRDSVVSKTRKTSERSNEICEAYYFNKKLACALPNFSPALFVNAGKFFQSTNWEI